MEATQTLTEKIKAEALRLGFAAVGVAKADRVSDEQAEHLRRWLEEGHNANMTYMNNYFEKRIDPRLLMDGLQSIVSVAMNYAPAHAMPAGQPQIAAYALGQDYHDVMKHRLFQLADFINNEYNARNHPLTSNPDEQTTTDSPQTSDLNFRVFVDSGPVLERYWAVQAGLGWIGRNRLLIIPKAGSEFFLGELFLNIKLDYDHPIANRCGRCHRCIDHCPTHALSEEGDFDANRCLSYQTIENRGPLSEEAKKAMGEFIYGCDRCQLACPWNRFATPNDTPEFQPKEELLQMTEEKWEHLSVEDYRRLFKGSAVKRAKYEGLMRNIRGRKP